MKEKLIEVIIEMLKQLDEELVKIIYKIIGLILLKWARCTNNCTS